jgi:hypothetical protein
MNRGGPRQGRQSRSQQRQQNGSQQGQQGSPQQQQFGQQPPQQNGGGSPPPGNNPQQANGNQQIPGQGMQFNNGTVGNIRMPTMSAMPISNQVRKRLTDVRTRRYKGPMGGLAHQAILNYNEPLFMRYWIPAMMRDPHLWYGIEMLRGPIVSKAKFNLIATDPSDQEYGQRQLKLFMTKGLPIALKFSLVWGYCPLETIYEYNEEQQCIDFAGFKFVHPNDARPVLDDGLLCGMIVKRIGQRQDTTTPSATAAKEHDNFNEILREVQKPKDEEGERLGGVYVGLPKCYWAVHDKTSHRWYGRSRLAGAFIPWYETWQPQGFRNIRHLWMYKNAFDSGVVKYPEGATLDIFGNPVPNVLFAEEMLDRKETGGGFALPSNYNDSEGGGWDWIPPEGVPVPDGLFDYGDSLRDEKWEGIGVPPEVAKSEDSGSFAGRRVPQQAFYSFLQEIANDHVFDWKDQNLQWMMNLRAGRKVHFEIEPVSILLTLQQEEMGQVTGHDPGDEGDGFYSEDDGSGEGDESGDPEGGGEFQENQLSNGRIEDRSTNGYNKAEKNMAKSKKK